jgi:hypothetical protein
MFKVEVCKKCGTQEENWKIKVSLAQIIELTNNLNLKYSYYIDKNIPLLESSLVEWSREID